MRLVITEQIYYQSNEKQKIPHAGADPGGASLPKIGKNMIFWRKIVIFHTKYPNNFRAPLRLAQFF
jgi:hypothetical protein